MIEQKSAPTKHKVGSLFFHLFNRLSLFLYTVLIKSIIGRALTSYDLLEQRWNRICTRIFGARDGRLRQRLHKLRLGCAHLIEHSIILRSADRLVKFFIYCPLNVYGTFFFMYGAVGAAVYFVAERLSVTYAGDLGWGIAGIIIAFASLPLICSGKPLYRAAFGSRIVGKMLRTYLGLEQSQQNEEKESGGTLTMYLALILGAGFGALTFFVHPATVPILLLVLALAILVLYIPESGILIAASTVCLWWITGYPVLCALTVSVITLIGYLWKLLLGKRVIHVQLLDFSVLLLASVFALHGLLTVSGALSAAYGVGYAILIAMYFPTVNLMRSREWLERCYRLLAISGAVLAVISVLPMAQIFNFLNMTLVRVDLSMFARLFERYETYFGHDTMVGGMLMLLLPIMLSRFVDKRTITNFIWKVFFVLAAFLSLLLSMHIGVWTGCIVMLVVFFFIYSHRSLSKVMLLAFPITCGAVWYQEINQMYGIRNFAFVQSMQDVIVAYADGERHRVAIAKSVLQMSKQHLLGVGFGDHAVYGALTYYAAPGMEHVTDVGSTYLQLLAECGYLGLFVLFAALLIFAVSVLTYLRWGGHQTTKARVVAGFSGVAGMLAMGLSCNLMNNAGLFGLLWLVIGLTVASLRTQYDVHARAVQTHTGNVEHTDIAFRTR